MKKFPVKHTKYVLLDANIIAGYYLPESLTSTRARDRIKVILDSVKNGYFTELCLFIPNICVAEIFGVFSKYYFATWDRHVKKNLVKKLSKLKYQNIRDAFRNDLHNGNLFQQIELNRYHILATDLISPIDAYFEFYRNRKNGKKRQKRMMGGTDHAIIGMGIYLNKIIGNSNFAILTADNRFADILTKATSLNKNTAKKLGIIDTASELAIEYSQYIYPQVINLAKTSEASLRNFMGVWPLPDKTINKQPLKNFSTDDCVLLSRLRKRFKTPRDKLPYSMEFNFICAEFERIKGQKVDKYSAWRSLSNFEKKPKK